MVESSSSWSTRGNWEKNVRLQMKADELERMFAEHKRKLYVKKFESESEPEPEQIDGVVVRGGNYERYMERRDERRREEWGVRREEKEGRRRKMWEIVERSRAELEKWYIVEQEHRLYMRRNGIQTRGSLVAEDEDQQSSDGSTKSVTSKILTSKSLSSSTSRTSIAPVRKPSSRPPSSSSSRNSIPNSDFRKENKKPSSYLHPTSIPRSKSTSSGSGTNYFKEDKPPRSGSLRKTSFTPILTQLRTTTTTTKEPKPFLKKGNGTKTSVAPELSDLQEESFSQVEAPLDSPSGSTTSSWFSQDGGRVRKKWGSVEMPVVATDKDGGAKGFKRFLNFGKKSRGGESKVPDWVSVSGVSGAGYSMDFGHGLASEETRSSGMGYSLHSFDGLSEGMRMNEQVQTPRRLVPTPANSKLKKDRLSETCPKSPRSHFSLSAFRSKGVESKLR